MALTSKISLDVVSTLTNVLDLATGRVPLNVREEYSWADGTAADQANRIFHDTRTLGASGSESLDLAGSLVDAYGATITFVRIKAIVVVAAAGNTNMVQLGGGSNPFLNWVNTSGDQVNVRPGGMFALVAPDATGYVVTASTGDLLLVTNSGGSTSVTYDIILIGASA